MGRKLRLENVILAVLATLVWASLLSCSSKKIAQDSSAAPEAQVATDKVERFDVGLPDTASTERPTPPAASAPQLFPMAHFGYDSAVLSKQEKAVIRLEAREMKKSTRSEILVVGACDERGSVAYNLKLGLRRAESVRAELEKQGVARRQIRLQSIGKSQPIAEGHDESAWAQNRRGEMHLSLKAPLAKR